MSPKVKLWITVNNYRMSGNIVSQNFGVFDVKHLLTSF